MCNQFQLQWSQFKNKPPTWLTLCNQPNPLEEFLLAHKNSLKNEYKPTDNILNIRTNQIIPSTNAPSILLSIDPWGAKPDWSKKTITNSRVEKLYDSPLWKKFIPKNRCLIPATSFFEWQEISGKKYKKQIEFLNPSTCLGGLYGLWEDIGIHKEGIWITILTQEGNPLMKKIHNSGDNQGRQPVVIKEKYWKSWLDPSIQSKGDILSMLDPFQEEEVRVLDVDNPTQPSLFSF